MISCTAPVRTGGLVCGAVIETRISARACGETALFAARKKPVLLLFLREGELTVMDTAGNRLLREEIDSSHAAAVDDFLSRAED